MAQRLARGLAARGHEVSVYAGHLSERRRPLSGWTEDDGHGVRVRWVVTAPWTAWSSPRNWDNPPVTADFRRWLDAERPDVVHLHSLQTLGAGLVSAAKESGAAVVLTMHDFWWTCARQFLVAKDMKPCTLVVDSGGCPCEGGHAWLEARNRTVKAHLGAADVVLAPSQSAARVLAANGVTGIRVDENGLPQEEPAAQAPPERRPDPQGRLRIMFAGGGDPMKGLPVLLSAARGLRDDGRWTLDLYGVHHLPGHLPSAVRGHRAYGREEMGRVMAEHDVLVLPSVMRESHSILTREALRAGLVVVCTDTLGPEEAVLDGVNGLVVPAADPGSLRAALQRLVDDRDEVERLRSAGLLSPLRPLEDQLDGLEQLYQGLVDARDAATVPAIAETVVAAETVVTTGAAGHGDLAGPSPEVLADLGDALPADLRVARDSVLHRVLFVSGITGAPLRYRAQLPAEALRLAGLTTTVRHYRDPEVVDLALAADAVVLYRVPATVQVVELVARIRERERPVPVLFDIDDLIFDPSLRGSVHGFDGMGEAEQDLWWRGVARYRTTMELCDAYVGSTDALCRHAAAATGLPTFRYGNGVGRVLGVLSERQVAVPREPGPLRIGYFSGTTMHDADWAVVEPAVVELMRARPDVELLVGGHLTTGPALAELGDRVRRLPMLPWQELPARLRQVDVNLAPLAPDSSFNEAKSAIKWLEAALVETPTVASPTEPFREAVDDGRTGFLAADHADWVTAIGRLLDDELLRRRMGALARREALLTWGVHTQAEQYLTILREAQRLVRADAGRDGGAWSPVLDDEPWDPAAAWLDPYPQDPAELDLPLAHLASHPWARRLATARAVLASRGPVALARATARHLAARRSA